jgi:alpha-L-fucosidase
MVAGPRATGYRPGAANLAAREWFQDARFGLFVHWGVYSVLGDGEWVMNNRKIPVADYEKLPAQFNPLQFDPAEWVALVKAAGMKYITITSKHHDGFAMFDSKASDYNIVARTPFGKDVLKALAEECRKQGIKLFFYYSQLDWHNPDYFPRVAPAPTRAGPIRDSGRDTSENERTAARAAHRLRRHRRHLVRRLVGSTEADWQLERTYALIHQLQPQALIGANHHRRPFPGEDFQMFEKDLPGGKTAEFNKDSEIGDLPLETCETMNGAWGFNITDRRYKSTRDLVRYLARAAGSNANFLLNVGPMPNGRIQPEFVTRLREIGAWTAKNGEAIYGTRGGPIAPQVWGVTTRRGSRVYVHVLDVPGPALLLPPLGAKVRGARFLASGRGADFSEHDFGVVVKLPADAIDPLDTVVALDLEGKASGDPIGGRDRCRRSGRERRVVRPGDVGLIRILIADQKPGSDLGVTGGGRGCGLVLQPAANWNEALPIATPPRRDGVQR